MINPANQITRLKEEIEVAKGNAEMADKIHECALQALKSAEKAYDLATSNQIFTDNTLKRMQTELAALKVIEKQIKDARKTHGYIKGKDYKAGLAEGFKSALESVNDLEEGK